MPLFPNKSHEELRWDACKWTNKGPKATPAMFGFMPQEGAAFSDVPTIKHGVPASREEKFVSIPATFPDSNKIHPELRSENCNASRPIQLHTSSAASNGLRYSCCCGHSLANLLTSALFTHNSPVVIGFAGQFPPDTLVLCQLQSSISVVPTVAEPWSKVPSSATSFAQTSTPTAFTWPEPGRNMAPQKTQNAPETLAKISGQTEGTSKSGFHSSSIFDAPPLPRTFKSENPLSLSSPPTFQCGDTSTPGSLTWPEPGCSGSVAPQKTQNAPESMFSTNKTFRRSRDVRRSARSRRTFSFSGGTFRDGLERAE